MNGLTDAEVKVNREKYGTNDIEKTKNKNFINIFVDNLGDPIIKILLIALAVKLVFLMKDFNWYETIGIVVAILLASIVSTISEYGSEKAFEKLQEEASQITSKVLRNKEIKEIKISEIVQNDIILLETGDKISADGIVLQGKVSVDESLINGEAKEKNKVFNDKLYRGTIVTEGTCYMKVNAVGNKTAYGNIAKELQVKSEESPLKIRLRHLAETISHVGYVGAGLVAASYLFKVIVMDNNFDLNLIKETISNFSYLSSHILHALTLCVTVVIVTVPEGLPMMITLVLSSNMKKLLKSNVLVRKLTGIETTGSLNILFTDKTGTLTKGKLEVVGILNPNLEIENYDEVIKNKYLKESIIINNDSTYDSKLNIAIGSNSTDRALREFIKENSYEVVLSKETFSSEKKYSTVTIENKTYIKGAYEKLLPKTTKYVTKLGYERTIINKNEMIQKLTDLASKGIRIVMLGLKKNNEIILLGFALIRDEPRENVKESLELVKKAGIRTIMITGDSKTTAKAIAKELNMLEENDLILTSDELNKLTDYELKQILPNLRVVARSLPSDKSRLVRISQELNLVTGMTGDGINDAPALKKADVGFSMGSGTEVAKEASDIVILDNNFLSITKAILFGRTIFKSIRKFIIFQLTVNICALTISIVGPFINIESPITVVQMLWINMVMDTLAGLAFSYEPPLLEYMEEKPKKKNERILNKYMVNEIVFTGLYCAFLLILFLKAPIFKQMFRPDIENKYFMTAFFSLFIFMAIFNSFNARTSRINILADIKRNPVFLGIILLVSIIQILIIYFGGNIFRTYGLTTIELLTLLFISLTVIPVDWLRKFLLKKNNKKPGV